MEPRNAINVWYSALAWKMKHTQMPMRSILDEAADAGTNNPSMRENVQMRNQIEKGVRSARRFGMAMDIATQSNPRNFTTGQTARCEYVLARPHK